MAGAILIVLAVLVLALLPSPSGRGRDRLAQERGGGRRGHRRAHDATYPVDQPEIVAMDSVRAYFPATLQRTHRLVGVDGCLRVRRVTAAKPSAAPGAWSPGAT